MSNQNYTMKISTVIDTDVKEAKHKIQQLKTSLDELNLPKEAARDFLKSFRQLDNYMRDFETQAASGIESLEDSTKIKKAWSEVNRLLRKTSIQLSELGHFPEDLSFKKTAVNVEKANTAIKNYQKSLDKAKETSEYLAQKKIYSGAVGEAKAARKKLDTPSVNLKEAERDYQTISVKWDKASEQKFKKYTDELEIQKLNKQQNASELKSYKQQIPDYQKKRIITAGGTINITTQKSYGSSEADMKLFGDTKESLAKTKKLLKSFQQSESEFEQIQKVLGEGYDVSKINTDKKNTKRRLKTAEKNQDKEKIQKEKDRLENLDKLSARLSLESQIKQKGIPTKDIKGSLSRIETLEKELDTIKQIGIELKQAEALLNDISISEGKERNYSEKIKSIEEDPEYLRLKELQKNLKTAESHLQSSQADYLNKKAISDEADAKELAAKQELEKIVQIASSGDLDALKKTFKELFNIDLTNFNGDIETLRKTLSGLEEKNVEEITAAVQDMASSFDEVDGPARKATAAIDQVDQEVREMTEAQKQVDDLRQSFMQLFSIGNAIEIFKRAIRDAFQTVKELDAAMTETAVVTDFSIEDMWQQLPEYTARANKLGVSILDAYEASTLYYQQGLSTNEVIAVSNETLKMGRIASLQAAEATNLMTAALRGFNMEVNETSAQRVNDVYSELAAITAADTKEIASAMTKTASIANTASMRFETTAALLSQIIETTRESAETAGTAMKTVIARFSEVRKLEQSGLKSGSDSEGEIIDVNKIQSALRTVGISMEDFFNGTEGLDSIFLKLASKWDTIDAKTQKYIATTAAGSRQQSRFLAMMSNYGRTMELVNAANNSAGASQAQFEKTLSSVETALERLKNAWDEFTMGLADHNVITFAINGLTEILTILNAITGILPGMGSSIAKLGIAFGAIKVGGVGAKALLGSFGNLLGGRETNLKGALKEELEKSFEGYGEILGGIKTYIKNFIHGDGFGAASVREHMHQNNERIQQNNERLNEINENVSDYNGIEDEWEAERARQADRDAIDEENPALRGENLVLEEEASQTDELGKAYKNAALAASGLAAVTKLVSTGLRAAGYQDAADQLDILANGFTAVAVAASLLPPILKALKLEMYATPIGIALLAITALVTGIAMWNKYNETATEKVSRLSKELDECKKATDEANKALQGVGDAKDSYEEAAKGLDKLVVGTTEWKNKLFEVNNQVLQLLETYPELAGFISRGNNGELLIDDAGWDHIIENKQTQLQNLQSEQFATQFELIQAETEEKRVNLVSDLNSRNLGVNFQNKNEELKKLTNFFTENKHLTEDQLLESEELSALLEETGIDVGMKASVIEAKDKFVEYGQSITASDLTKNGVLSSMVYSQLDTKDIQKAYAKDFITGFSQYRTENYEDDIKAKKENYAGMTLKALQEEYFERTGQEAGDDIDVIKQDLARMDVGQDYAKQASEAMTKVAALGEDKATQLAGLLSGNVAHFKKSDAKKNFDSDYFGYTKEEFKQAFNLTDEQMGEVLTAAQNIEQEFDKVDTEVANKTDGAIDLTGKEFLKDATLQQYEAYGNLMIDAMGRFGQEGEDFKNFVSGFDDLFGSLSAEDQAKMLDLASSYDFTKGPEEAQKFFNDLKTMGIYLPSDAVREFTGQLKLLGDGFEEIDPTKTREKVKKALDFADTLDKKENNVVTEEERTYLIEQGVADESSFFWDGQQWLYLEGPMNDLASAVRENTAALQQKDKDALQGQIDNGQEVAKKLEHVGEYTVEYVEAMGDKFIPSGVQATKEDFLSGKLALEDVKEILGLGDVTDAEAQRAYEQAIRDYNNLETNQNKMDYLENVLAGNQYGQMSGQELLLAEPVTEAEVEQWNNAFDALAIKEQGLAGEVEATIKALKAQGSEFEQNSKLVQAHLYDVRQTEKAIIGMNKAINENKDVLKAGKSAGVPYYKALDEIHQKAKEIFGEDLSKEFVEQNIDDFIALSEGGEIAEEAYNRLYEARKTAFLNTTEDAKLVKQALAAIENAEFNIHGEADLSNVWTSFQLTYEKARDLANQITSLGGYQVSIEEMEDGTFKTIVSKIDGGVGLGNYKPSGGGGGGGSKDWENPYDKLYNSYEKLNQQLREREVLERRYQKLLESRDQNAAQMLANAKAELANLKEQEATQKYILASKEQQMRDFMAENSDMAEYGHYDEDKKVIVIDWEKIDSIKDTEKGGKIDKYIKGLEGFQKQIDEAEDGIQEIEDQVKEINERGKDEFFDLEASIKEAVVDTYQKQIDELEKINENITDTNGKLIEGIQSAIDKERQDRENSKTEEELSDKQRRLLYLQQDTSGANDLEILDLEKELAEGQEDYTDSLIDQKINELQEQNDKAAEQRQNQIDLAQAQLDTYVESGEIWKEIHGLMDEGLGQNGLIRGSKLEEILQSANGWEAMSTLGQMDWLKTLEENVKASLAYLKQGRQLENLDVKEGTSITFSHDGKTYTGKTDKEGNVIVGDKIFKDVYQSYDGSYKSDTEGEKVLKKTESEKAPETKEEPKKEAAPQPKYYYLDTAGGRATGDFPGRVMENAKVLISQHYDSLKKQKTIYLKDSKTNIEQDLERLNRLEAAKQRDIDNLDIWKVRAAYKTGGLADFTGPAWLDGTKSHPEIVLNARDSQNFLTLKDILASLLNTTTSTSSEKRGDNHYDIDINVEKIDSDYDVEDMANKIKHLIVDDAMYRNVNAIDIQR